MTLRADDSFHFMIDPVMIRGIGLLEELRFVTGEGGGSGCSVKELFFLDSNYCCLGEVATF